MTNQLERCWPVHRLAGRSAAGLREATGGGGSSSDGGGSIMDLRDNVETRETENQLDFFYFPIPDEAPCKAEQEKLSGVVKNLHRKLRRKYREGKQPRLGRCAPV